MKNLEFIIITNLKAFGIINTVEKQCPLIINLLIYNYTETSNSYKDTVRDSQVHIYCREYVVLHPHLEIIPE